MKAFSFLAQEHNVDFFAWCYHGDAFFDRRFEHIVGARLHQLIVRFDKFYGEWGTPEEEWNSLGEKIIQAIQSQKLNVQNLKTESEKVAQQIVAACQQLSDEKIKQASDAELAALLTELYEHSAELVALGFIPVASDFYHAALTKAMETTLSSRSEALKERNLSVAEAVSFLSSAPLSPHAWAETQGLFFAAQVAADKGIGSEFAKKALKEHAARFGWINYGYLGPLSTENDFQERVIKILRKYPDPQKALLTKQNERQELGKRQFALLEALGLNPKEHRLFDAARVFLYLKALRVDVRSLASYTFDRLFKEIGRRFGLTKNQLHCANLEEITGLIAGKPLDAAILNKRYSGFTYYWSDEGERFLYGKEEHDFLNRYRIQEKINASEELRGQVACPGMVKGRVKIVMTAADNGKVIHGDILVSLATNPDLLPAMHRAKAFVTDMGGITSHAAIVAREMNKPCVIGTKFASKILKDGDYIEVDATEGIVRKIGS